MTRIPCLTTKWSLMILMLATTFLFLKYVTLKNRPEHSFSSTEPEQTLPPVPIQIYVKPTESKHPFNLTPVSNDTISRRHTEKQGFVVNCKKITNVAFLKVHKAGSSTVQNIFLRFARSHDLNVALSKETAGDQYHYLGFNRSIDVRRLIPTPKDQQYNILCSHVVYNRDVFKKVMPSDSIYIGIIRDPITHFISSGTYFHFFDKLRKRIGSAGDILNDFILQPNKYHDVSTFWVHNRMTSDFGLLPINFNDASVIDNLINDLDVDFKLIMVMERFEESIVLMKRYLCWDLKDLLFIERNVHKNNKPLVTLTDQNRKWLQKWNMAEFMLYQHFERKFSDSVSQQGSDFQKEVEHFKSINIMTKSFCRNPSGRSLEISESAWNAKFEVTVKDCELMLLNEIPFLSQMKHIAFSKLK